MDPEDVQFSDTSLLDLAADSWSSQPQASQPVQTQMYDQPRAVEPVQRLTPAQAMAKAGSVIPGMSGATAQPGAPVVANQAAVSGSYTPFLLAGLGAIAGGMYAGWWGAASGALGVGALVNANRWRKGYVSKRMDGAFALATMGGAVYAGYKAHQHRQNTAPKPSHEPDVLELDDEDQVEPNSTKPARRAWLRPVRTR